jgi:hypothetical protein
MGDRGGRPLGIDHLITRTQAVGSGRQPACAVIVRTSSFKEEDIAAVLRCESS